MIRFVAIAAIGALSAVGAARAVVSLDPAHQVEVLRPAARPAPEPASGPVGQIAKAADGHYWAEGDVGGRAVRFLVDTGATAVALTVEDARRLGYDPARLDYRYEIMTADGRARAAAVRLARVTVAGASVENVEALVIEKGLHTSLLGMSYLGRLTAFEATRTALILKP
ncbi:MAG: TIGR02281 family clan AA aspartic protease [Pseudomonadota bacterium]